ncbi:MAG: site-specific integrase [Verrucomicrobia bacterium]|nr:site-specific integrase [Verrucomicrobiota bacterium]
MEQKESLEKVENDFRGIIVRTHRHCQTYRVRIRMKGGQCFDRSFGSKTLAKKWKRDMESAIEHDRYEFTNPATKHTLADLIGLYIERVLPGKPRNAKNVFRHLMWWKEELGHLLLAQVRPSLIAEKRDELLSGLIKGGKLRSPTTVVRYLSSLSHVFTKAVKEWEWMRENPVFKIEKPKQAQGRKRVLTEEEQQRLLQECQESGSKDLFLIVALALGTGMRKGEIMGLRWKNVQLEEPTGTIVLEKTKNGRSRSVLITGLLLGLLQKRHKLQRADSLVFPSPNYPNQPVDIRSAWEKALQKAGIEGFVFHGLRHQAASQAATIENSPLVIGEMLGHQTLQMTRHYVHLPSAHMQTMVEALQSKIFQNYQESSYAQFRK